ncbi:serine hydrolase domain-containing protein [Shinella zoogloeoides]|uniref:Serine hydrolase n=1 Tax=Shinella zoogloeoides TaxID=352475 RepID=A0A6N8TEP8_SHIZO|nr:serine hydrolase [Shinella zoogloeoides]MXO00646.1 serine hydrolase [Shinella zoogloeoides]UEX80075.1 beta-lactamase family protein [Shinella zoogloeoides]
MGRFYRLAAWPLSLLVLVILVGASWIIVSPPSLLSVGSGYAAKIVCSNVFIAGRDPQQVLALDVQAPGHPLLRLMRQNVDLSEKTVTTHLLGVFAPGHAVWNEGFGCSTVPDGDFRAARQAVSDVPLPAISKGDPAVLWPAGEAVTPDPRISALLADPALTGPGMRAVVVVHDGRIVAEAYGEGFAAETPLLGWSMAKSVNAALLGRVFQAGGLSPRADNLFVEWRGDARSRITLAQLLAMESGLAFNEGYGGVADVTRMLFLEPDMTRFVLSLPLEVRPGERFNYSSGTAVLLSRLWMEALGGRVQALSFPAKALFGPLGMASAVMETDETGIFVGSSYMYATARDWARFSLLLLNDGVWNGVRLLPEGFVTAMATPSAASGGAYSQMQTWTKGPGDKSDADYGLPAGTFWMRGHDGQSAAIVPARGLAVIRLGLTPSKLDYRPQTLIRRILDVLDAAEAQAPT